MKARTMLTSAAVGALAAACASSPETSPPVAPAAPVVESTTSAAPRSVPSRNPDGAFGVKTVDPPVDVPGRRHKASARALELLRRADALTYRPTDHGLRALRCNVEFTTTGLGKNVYRAAYVMTAPGRSTLTLVSETTDPTYRRSWGDGSSRFDPSSRCRATLNDLFDGPRLERLVDAYELEMREEAGKQFVLARRAAGETAENATIDLRFGADGTLVQDGPGDRAVHPFCSSRRMLTYDRQGDQFRRRGAALFDESRGMEQFKYDTIGGILIPIRHATVDSGMTEQLTITDVEVNPPDLGR